jgi:hypothetical protein
MAQIDFRILNPEDQQTFHLIADWYLNEWKIPKERSLQRLKEITTDKEQMQVLMSIDRTPIATCGIYNYVSLLEKEPRFKIFKHWLALVYTIPPQRHKGYGALICNYIQEQSRSIGMDKLYLFTDSAESLYKRLGWEELERVSFGERKVVVMQKQL